MFSGHSVLVYLTKFEAVADAEVIHRNVVFSVGFDIENYINITN